MIARYCNILGERHDLIEDFSTIQFDGIRQQLKVAVGDWANSLIGGPYQDAETASFLGRPADEKLNGGVIGSAIAKRVIETCDSTGTDLVRKINQELRRKYEKLGIRNYDEKREATFTGYIAHVIANSDEAIITAVGDVRCAVDGVIVAGKTKAIDLYNATLRKRYLEKTGDFEGEFEKIVKPAIIGQYQYQNTPGHKFSYPAIDGTETKPIEEIQVIRIPTPEKILLWTDGYETPEVFTIEGLEEKLQQIYKADPLRYKEFPATSSKKDDRTAVEILFDSWDEFTVEEVKA